MTNGMREHRTPGLPQPVPSAAVSRALSELAAGRMIVVTDDADRENEGDLVTAAESVTAEMLAFMVRHTTGIVCAPMPAGRVDDLQLPQMVARSTDPHDTAFTVSVDMIGTGTGVSASNRARTLRALADESTMPDQLRRPGHVFPLRARAGGVLERPGHTEAAVDLLTLADLSGVGVIGELVAEDGSMLAGDAVTQFAHEHSLHVLAIDELVRYRREVAESVESVEPVEFVEFVADAALPTRFGDFTSVAFRDSRSGVEHLALVLGEVSAAGKSQDGVLVRIHSECLTGDVFGSLRCDCGTQLAQALAVIGEEGCGVVVYLRGHEGRGIGLAQKMRAYALQDGGLDTVDANVALGLPVDSRSFDAGAGVVQALDIQRVRLMTNNPAKRLALHDNGIEIVECVPMPSATNSHNIRYLSTKHDRLGHRIVPGPLWTWEF
ncbi:GTP cyclohydrolase II [Rhodococcus qingshengii]|uniref:GTP cyclohydrolase II n=1 Tax=Rhodococcus qingshengii TaxID=334542 RepID=UPI000B32F8A9|nr:GTP cyclohydrolase II [Rhodococcus qingshengii]